MQKIFTSITAISMLTLFLIHSMPQVQAKCTGSIGNMVWDDRNDNGIKEADEAGIPWVGVWLYQGNKFYTDATDERGHYKFNDLCEGRFVVTVKAEDVGNRYQAYDPDGKYDHSTVVWLDGDKDKHTKADFGYRSALAPATGASMYSAIAAFGVTGLTTALTLHIRNRRKKA